MSTGTAISLDQYLSSIYEPDCDYVDGEIEERNVGEWGPSTLQIRIGAFLLAKCGATGAKLKTIA
jgi:hypothetical protein